VLTRAPPILTRCVVVVCLLGALVACSGDGDRRSKAEVTTEAPPPPPPPPPPDPELPILQQHLPSDLPELAEIEIRASITVETEAMLERTGALFDAPTAPSLFDLERDYPASVKALEGLLTADLAHAPAETAEHDTGNDRVGESCAKALGIATFTPSGELCWRLTARDCRGAGILHLAVERGDVGLAQRLVELAPGLVSTRDGFGRTPALVAASAGDTAMFNALGDRAREDDTADISGGGMVHQLVRFGVRRDLAPDRRRAGVTAFVAALGDTALRSGVVTRDADGRTPLMLAVRAGEVWLVERLSSLGRPSTPGDFDSPLHVLARHADRYARAADVRAVFRRLARDGDELKAVSSRGLTVLGEAVVHGAERDSRLLIPSLVGSLVKLEGDQDPFDLGPTFKGWSAVRVAMWLGRLDVASALVAAGAPPDPVWEAAKQPTVRSARALEEWSALGPDGLNSAHYAAYWGNGRFLKNLYVLTPQALMVAAAAHARDGDQSGWTIWHAAMAGGSQAVVKVLGALGPEIQELRQIVDAQGISPGAYNGWRATVARADDRPRSVAVLLGPAATLSSPRFSSPGGVPEGASGPQQGGFNSLEMKPDTRSAASRLPNQTGGDLDTTGTQGRAEGGDQRRGFTTLGFGGAYQVRELALEEDFFAGRLGRELSPAARLVEKAPPGAYQAAGRSLTRRCFEAARWREGGAAAVDHVAAVDGSDPFDLRAAMESLLLVQRAELMQPGLASNTVAKATDGVLGLVAHMRRAMEPWGARQLELDVLRGGKDLATGDVHAAVSGWRRAIAAALSLVGTTRFDRGDFAGAEAIFDKGIKEAAGDETARAHLLGHLGRLRTETGRYQEALTNLTEARKLRRAIFGPTSAEFVASAINLGVVYELLSRREEARDLWEEALEGLLKAPAGALPKRLYGALVANNLGRLSIFAGQIDDARALLDLASRALRATPQAPSWLGGRISLSLGDLAALDPSLADPADGPEEVDLDVRTEHIASAKAHFQAAIGALEAAHGPDHPLLGRALWRMADLGRFDDPRLESYPASLEARSEAYARAFVMTRGSPAERWPLAFAWSQFEAQRGQDAAAYFLSRAAVAALGTLRDNVAPEGERAESRWLSERLEVYRMSARLALNLGRPADAVSLLGMKELESHAAFTRSQLHRPSADQVPHDPREAKLAGVVGKADETVALPADGLRTRVKEVRAFLRELEALRPDVRAHSATLVDQAKAARAFQGTLRRVGAGVVWVHLVPTAEDITAIITTPTTQFSRTHALEGPRLAPLVEAFVDAILSNQPTPEVAARALYDAVLAPFRADLGDAKTIYIAADGPLRDLPFSALHDGAGWLVESFAFVTASALTTSHLGLEPPALADWRVAGFGVSKAHDGFPALPGVLAELNGVIRTTTAPRANTGVFPGTVVMDEAFAPEALLTELHDDGAPAVFIASHFKLGRSDEDSFLLTGDGGHLTVSCLENCDSTCLPACDKAGGFTFEDVHLAVFSACQTAQQMVMAQEGRKKVKDAMSSLADVAAILGAHSVIGTLWPVNDPSTAAWMRAFFERLRASGGRGKAHALRQTAADMAGGQIGGGKWVHPYYWAPFVLLGNAR